MPTWPTTVALLNPLRMYNEKASMIRLRTASTDPRLGRGDGGYCDTAAVVVAAQETPTATATSSASYCCDSSSSLPIPTRLSGRGGASAIGLSSRHCFRSSPRRRLPVRSYYNSNDTVAGTAFGGVLLLVAATTVLFLVYAVVAVHGFQLQPATSRKLIVGTSRCTSSRFFLSSGAERPPVSKSVDSSKKTDAPSQEATVVDRKQHPSSALKESLSTTNMSVPEATELLVKWDRAYNLDPTLLFGADEETQKELDAMLGRGREDGRGGGDGSSSNSLLVQAVRTLNKAAARERSQDPAKGRCMLGICASSAQEGLQGLKSFVTNLQLPRGLLHGMDKDGVPLELDGGVYIKYNTGGVYTFADIRKSGMGFDALWKPGDALLEPYDGNYRGVYFQVELSEDDEFRQYLVPLDLFDDVE